VDRLHRKGVKAILNLQRDQDMERMNINWNSMKEIYASKDMDVVNFQIKDKTPDRIGERILMAAKILNEMIQKFEVDFIIFLFINKEIIFLDCLCSLHSRKN